MNIFSFEAERSKRVQITQRFKSYLFKLSTSFSTSLFVRGRDTIATKLQVDGVYEPELSALIEHCNVNGYSDYLIDIGANIGVITCQSGLGFKRVVCFEPNPICANILRANVDLLFSQGKVVINEFALGQQDCHRELWIPKNNFGGAFIRSEENRYSDSLLASKDNFINIDPDNYIIRKVDIRNSVSSLQLVFSDLEEEGFLNGVIKIDVEGMEMSVIEGIAKSLPKMCKIVIVFENLDSSINSDEINKLFSGRDVKLGVLTTKVILDESNLPLFRLIGRAFGIRRTSVGGVLNRNGDLIIQIN